MLCGQDDRWRLANISTALGGIVQLLGLKTAPEAGGTTEVKVQDLVSDIVREVMMRLERK